MNKLIIVNVAFLSAVAFAGDGAYNVKCVSGTGRTKVTISYSDSGGPTATFSLRDLTTGEFKTVSFSDQTEGTTFRSLVVADHLEDKVFTTKGETSYHVGTKSAEFFDFWAVPTTVTKQVDPEFSKKYVFDAKIAGTDPRTGELLSEPNGQTSIDVSCTYTYSL